MICNFCKIDSQIMSKTSVDFSMSSEPCLICLSSSPFVSDGGEVDVDRVDPKFECLDPHLRAIFVLRNLLRWRRPQCEEMLRRTSLSPGNWFSLCDNCGGVVRQCLEVQGQIAKLSKVLEKSRDALRNWFLQSLEVEGGRTAWEEEGVKSVHQLIREGLKETEDSYSRSELMEAKHKVRKRRKIGIAEKVSPRSGNPVKVEHVQKIEDDSEPVGGIEDGVFECSDSNSELIADDAANDEDVSLQQVPPLEPLPAEKGHLAQKKVHTMKPLKSVAYSRIVKKHLEFLDGDKWVRCRFCGLEDTRLRISRHISLAHASQLPSRKEVRCGLCEKTFHASKELQQHVLVIHENRWRFYCEHCGKGFMKKVTFEDHRANHSGPPLEKRYICEECGLGCTTRRGLHKHISNFHNANRKKKLEGGGGDSPSLLKCKYCGLMLQRHGFKHHRKLVHYDLYVLKCEFCEEKFISKKDVQQHICNIHKDLVADRFKCDRCGLQYVGPRKFNKHRKVCKEPEPSSEPIVGCSGPSEISEVNLILSVTEDGLKFC